MSNGRTLLILPCTDQKPYSESRTWSYVLGHIGPWRDKIDLAAIDCITNPTDRKPFGIVMEWDEWKTKNLDERPSKDKINTLTEQVFSQLKKADENYSQIVAYVNVKSYWQVLWSLRKEHHIRMLPRLFHDPSNWNSSNARISPRGAFYKYISELTTELNRLSD
jgi:hypothetical protein